MTSKPSVAYRDAGADIDGGDDALVDRIKPAMKRSMRHRALAGLGGFGARFKVPIERYRKPVLVSGTDGVGTKLRLAIETTRHDTIGIDLVAMCANYVVVQGAEALFFLDYYATGKISVEVAVTVVTGIVEGSTTKAGDAIIGLASSGPHSNGYSLIPQLLKNSKRTEQARLGEGWGEDLGEGLLYEALLAPTRICVKPLLKLVTSVPVRGLAHITGGGLTDNIPRMIPDRLDVVLHRAAWRRSGKECRGMIN